MTLPRIFSDLALIPRICRSLMAQARADRDRAVALARYQAARAADPEGVAELRRLSSEPLDKKNDRAVVEKHARCREIMSRWERGPVSLRGFTFL